MQAGKEPEEEETAETDDEFHHFSVPGRGRIRWFAIFRSKLNIFSFFIRTANNKMSGFRVLTAEWCHETNTFSVFPTTMKNFHDEYYYDTPEEILKERKGTKSPIGATYEAAEKYNWVLETTLCASANPAGTIIKDTFELMADKILSHCAKGKFDGILLHLHGAMVAEGYQDAEGELLQRMRNIVGNDIPIMVTLDLHGNITSLMTEKSTLLLAVRTYPHIDFYESACRAADLLQQTMEGKIKPFTVIAKRPMLMGLDGGKTTHPDAPMTKLLLRIEEMEDKKEILLGSVCAGFTAADIYDIGPSVTITVDLLNKKQTLFPTTVNDLTGFQNYAMKIANDCMDFVWETRSFKSENYHSLESAMNYCTDFLQNKYPTVQKPLVIADITDNPGSGHYGDTTGVLKAMIDSNISDVVFYAIFDPMAVQEGIALGIGQTGEITLGGKSDPTMGGGPLKVKGRLVTISDGCYPTYGPMGFGGCWRNAGPSILFRVGNNIDVILITNNCQLMDLAQITSVGCDPIYKKIIAVKSKQHFRACLTPVASEIIAVDGGGLGSAILSFGEYKNVRRPIWPLDNVEL
jgi:microcystin degradation protein MlrC